VRMLLDRGLLVQEGPSYRLTGPVEALEVPDDLRVLAVDQVLVAERRGRGSRPAR